MSAPPEDGPLEEARRVLAGQAKMRAIKLYRDANRSGWAEAAAAVDRIRAGRAPSAAKTPALPSAKSSGLRLRSASGRVIERRRFSPALALLALAALFGTIFGLVVLLFGGR